MSFLPERNALRPADDPIFALNREATQRRTAGEAIVNATIGAMLEDDGSLALMPSVIEALRDVPSSRVAAYAPIAGDPVFLKAAIDDLLGGSSLQEQAVAVATPGGTGALRHAVSTFLELGQSLITTSFYWGPYATICDEHQRTLSTFPMFDEAGSFNVGALERALAEASEKQDRLLVFLNDPCHNPTGYSMTDAEWSAVADVLSAAALRRPLTVLADIAYYTFARNADSRFVHRLAPLAERALVCFAWSASKAFSAYGVRVGALIACTADRSERDKVRNALTYACRATWSNCAASGQHAIARCLTEPALRDRVIAERSHLTRKLHARVERFNQLAHDAKLRFPRYDGGFFCTVFTKDAPVVAARLREAGIFVVPQAGALRLALCSVAEADIPRLVDGLHAAIG